MLGLFIHIKGAFYYPSPFCDEMYFFLSSRSFAEHNSFFAEELHSKRTLFWMPFGYPFLNGLIFKILGTNILFMRHLSFVSITLAYFSLAYWSWFRYFRFGVVLLLGFFFISNPWMLAAGLARMESIVMACLTIGLVLGSFQKWMPAWFFVFSTVFFHPIGFSFLLCFFIFWQILSDEKRLSHFLLPGFFALPIWVISNLGIHFDFYLWQRDWAFQLAGKSNAVFLDLLFRWRSLIIIISSLLISLFLYKRGKIYLLAWSILCPLFYFFRIYGQGLTYGIYTSLGIFFLSFVVVELLFSVLKKNNRPRYFYAAVLFFILGILLVSKVLQIPIFSDKAFSLKDYRTAPTYLTENELTTVRVKLDSICLSRNWKKIYISPEIIGAKLYFQGQRYIQIVHNFENTVPDGILCFTQSGDAFESDLAPTMSYFNVTQKQIISIQAGDFSKNWFLFPNQYKKLNPNRLDALKRCADAGIVCPN